MRTRMGYAEEPTVDIKFCLVFPREALSVPVMRHVLGDTLRGLGADEDGLADLLLAVTEACTNVVRHGGPGLGYEVVASVGKGGCVVEVQDSGPGFDTRRVARLRQRRVGWPVMATPVRIRRRVSRPATFGRPHRWNGRTTRNEMVAALPESGRGLAIMEACVDGVTLSSGPGSGTVVSLQKRIAWRKDALLARPPAGQLRNVG